MFFRKESYFTYLSKMDKTHRKMCFKEVEEYHFTPNEILVLMFLSNNPDFDTARDIAYYKNSSKGLIAKSVEDLANQGYLILKKDEKDRRKIHLILSKKSKEVVERIRKCSKNFQDHLLEGVSKEHLEILNKTCDIMEENLERMIEEMKKPKQNK